LLDSALYESEEEGARREEVLARIGEVIFWFLCIIDYLFEENSACSYYMFTFHIQFGDHF